MMIWTFFFSFCIEDGDAELVFIVILGFMCILCLGGYSNIFDLSTYISFYEPRIYA